MLRAPGQNRIQDFSVQENGTKAKSLLVAEYLNCVLGGSCHEKRSGARQLSVSEVGEGRLSGDGTLTRKWGGV